MKWLRQLKSALITALVVFVAMQLLVAVIQPYIPLILIGIAVTTVGYLFLMSRRL